MSDTAGVMTAGEGGRPDRGPAFPGEATPTGPPLIPLVMLGITAVGAIVLGVGAALHGAGTTDEISMAAVTGWLFGCLIGLLVFAWFGTLDAGRRATGRYVEPEWRPRAIGIALAVVGFLAGAYGAYLVAQSVARR